MRDKAVIAATKAAADSIRRIYDEGAYVDLSELLRAREERVQRQQSLIERCRTCGREFSVVSFTLNIAGAVKDCSLFSWAFDRGVEAIAGALGAAGIKTEKTEITRGEAGDEFMAIACAEPGEVKLIMAETEELHPLGRIFDIDVLDRDGKKVSRTDLGASGRTCILCGKPAFVCGRSRAHSIEDVIGKQIKTIASAQADETVHRISENAVTSLLAEVHTGPKPGLVDRFNSGAHRDMDEGTFIKSAEALRGYFTDCAYAGMYYALTGDDKVYESLISIGITAEKTMLEATGGVNTHKGAIFSMGIFACAAGMSEISGRDFRSCVKSLGEKLSSMTVSRGTAGDRISRETGIGGIREEAAKGYPAVFEVGLPVLKREITFGDAEDAALKTLLHIILAAEDTNVIARGGLSAAKWLREEAADILAECEYAGFDMRAALTELDRRCIDKNLSPGGSADLLGLCLFTLSVYRDLTSI